MKRLILMRHAKSSWDDPFMTDHERPLNARGKRSATAIGEWLRQENLKPDQCLSSDSVRTTETFNRLQLTCAVRYLEGLYHAPAGRVAAILRKADGDTVLMLGHNPGIGAFAQDIVVRAPAHPRFDDYPTCATLVAAFDIAKWSDLEMRTGKVQAFMTPRELID